MRISGWLLGIAAFIALILFTGVCAFTSYAFTRENVISLWDSGIQVNSAVEVVQALTNPRDAATSTPTPDSGDPVVVIASPTPFPTAVLDAAAPTSEADASSAPAEITADTVEVVSEPTPIPTLNPAESYRWDDPRQVRILLMGIDQRTGIGVEEERAHRTDSMILVNVDPVRNTVGVISFPRDLWVNIPDYSQARINTANYIGDLNAYPGGGGPALAMETIRTNFGIRVDYFVQVNFTVFETVVDLLAPNGAEVCPAERIFDEYYPDSAYGFITVEFPAGCQRLNGEQLLQYARTRHGNSDFDRARRQQEVLDSLRRELLSAGGIQNFLTQIPALFSELAGSYRTNLTIEEIIGLGLEINEIDGDSINYLVLGEEYVTLGQNQEGDEVVFPIYSRITEGLQRVLFPEQGVTTADLRARAQAEGATIYVYNGTDVAGLAGRTREWLIGNHQVPISQQVGNTPNPVQRTQIRNYSGGADTALWLADILGLPASSITPGTDGIVAEGVVVVAGPDIQAIIDR